MNSNASTEMFQPKGRQFTDFELANYNFDLLAQDVADAKGLVVVLPQPNQLQIDLDTVEAMNEFDRRCGTMFDTMRESPVIHRNYSASGHPHSHITLTFKREFTEWERITIQAALGDDPLRVFLNTRRLLAGIPNPSRLFETKEEMALREKKAVG